MRRVLIVPLAAGIALVLADAAIVVLALPELLEALDTTIEGVAAIVALYTGVLAVACPIGARIVAHTQGRAVAATGAALFALASLGAAASGSLEAMLVARAVQAAGGAAMLMGAYALLAGDGVGRRAWSVAGIAGTAAGPALGGALTQAFGWQAIFVFGAPVALGAAVAALLLTRERGVPASSPQAGPPRHVRLRAQLALALVSAALTAVLFLAVLMLITGWSLEPLAAAAVLSALPAGALLGTLASGEPRSTTTAGALLIAGGVGALAAISGAPVAAVIAPLAVAGLGMGLALPALGERLLSQRGLREAASTVAVRHAGVTLALLALAPLIASELDVAVEEARERQVAVLLDAPLGPLEKIELVPVIFADTSPYDPRGGLQRSFARAITQTEDPQALRAVRDQADTIVTSAVDEALELPLLLLGAAALAAALLLPPPRALAWRLAPAGAVAVAVVALTALATADAAEPVAIRDPCETRPLPDSGGLAGEAQKVFLKGLDAAACRLGSSREELVLALADEGEAREFERVHGVNPRRVVEPLLELLDRPKLQRLLDGLGIG